MGHIQDRWYRQKIDPETGELVFSSSGRPVLEKTERHGIGKRYKVRYLSPDNKERSKSFPDRQKRQAEDFLIGVEADKREGRYIDPAASVVTFRQQAENWLKGQSPDPGTREVLHSRLTSRIYPSFGDVRVGRITPSMVRDWLGELDERRCASNYQVALFTLVSAVLDAAVDDRLIRDNPCKAKTVRRPVGTSPRVVVWTEKRVHAVRAGLGERFGIVVPLGSGLGLRQGEILAISPDDIDRAAQVALIQRQLKTVNGVQMFALPKGGKTRTVPVSGRLLDVLDEYGEMFPPVEVKLPWRIPDGEQVAARLMVTGENGRLYSGDLFTKVVWQNAFKAAGLTYRPRADGMHGLRHFYASTLLSRGVSIKEVAEYLGHADAGFTLRTYTHLVPSSHERARQAVDAVFGSETDGPETARS